MGNSYTCNDCVSIVRSDKVLYFARCRSLEVVSTDEVRRKIEFGRVRARCAIGRAIDSLLCSSSHFVCRNSHAQVAVVKEGKFGGRSEVGQFLVGSSPELRALASRL